MHVWSVTNIPALISVVLSVMFCQYSLEQSQSLYQQTLRTEVANKAHLLSSNLEGNINADLQLVKGLVSVLSTQPDMSALEWTKISKNLFDGHTELTVLAAAPDLVISMIYPFEGNEAAIGLDYNKNVAQRAAALRARDTGRMVLAGPVNLVQGGRGFIGRYPVFVYDPDGSRRFWGIVSAVMDVDTLFKNSGLLDRNLPIEFSLAGKDALGFLGDVFYGPDILGDSRNVNVGVRFPNGSWLLSARPKGGWDQPDPNAWQLRFAILLAALLIVAPALYSGYLMRRSGKQNLVLKEQRGDIATLTERLNVALASSNIGVWESNLATGHNYWDDRTTGLFGFENPEDRTDKHNWIDSLHPDDLDEATSKVAKAVVDKGQLSLQFRIITPKGEIRTLQSRCTYYHEAGRDPKLIGVNWDITEDRELKNELVEAKKLADLKNIELEDMQVQIQHLALHDPLTSLPNRRYLDQQIIDFEKTEQPGDMIAMLSLDLDRFKQINDSHGHLAGDATLAYVADLLRKCVDETDFVARVGGDEFIIIVERDFDKAELAAIAGGIVECLKEPLIYDGRPCRTGASIGIAYADKSKADLKGLMIKSDIALYRAKELGRNCFEFFANDQQEKVVKEREVAEEIIWGLELGQFVPHYQPQFDTNTLEIIGVEALARWEHPHKGLVPPFEFLKVAENIDVIDDIDHEVLTAVVDDLKLWDENGVDIKMASVNVSSPRLNDENLMRRLSELDIKPGTITFELLESIYLDDQDDDIDNNLARIKEMGIDLEIDDFGTGHASIVSLLKLNPKGIKIDRQFVSQIADSEEQARLTKSMIDMGKSLGIQVLAEGVETQEQVEILRELGADSLQGFLYAKPMPANELVEFVREHNAKRKAS